MATSRASFRGVCSKNSAQIHIKIQGWLGEIEHFSIDIEQPLLETATKAEFLDQERWLLDKLDLLSIQMLCGIMDDVSQKVFEQPYFVKPKSASCDLELRFFNQCTTRG